MRGCARRDALCAALSLLRCLASSLRVRSRRSRSRRRTRVLDRFDDLDAVAGGALGRRVARRCTPAAGIDGPALRLDFDLARHRGLRARARARCRSTCPTNYEISFDLRADAPVNDFQVKLVDDSGENVWWFRRPNFALSARVAARARSRSGRSTSPGDRPRTARCARRAHRVRRRRRARRRRRLVYFSDLELRELPPRPHGVGRAVGARIVVRCRTREPALAVDGNAATAWRSDPADRPEQYAHARLRPAARIRRPGAALASRRVRASRYDVQFSDDGAQWRTVRSVTTGAAASIALLLPECETRYVRLALHDGPGARYALGRSRDRATSRSAPRPTRSSRRSRANLRAATFRAASPASSRTGRSSASTAAATPACCPRTARSRSRKGGFSIEPFVRRRRRASSPGPTSSIGQSLRERLPADPERHLAATALDAARRPRSRRARARSRSWSRATSCATSTDRPLAARARPRRAAVPGQPARRSSSMRRAASRRSATSPGTDGALTVNGERDGVSRCTRPSASARSPFDSGPHRRSCWRDAGRRVDAAPRCTTRSASRRPRCAYPLHARAARHGARSRWRCRCPVRARRRRSRSRDARTRGSRASRTPSRRAGAQGSIASRCACPPAAQPLVDTLRTALAHILITRDGPILRPGTRSYARSWIRDGAMMARRAAAARATPTSPPITCAGTRRTSSPTARCRAASTRAAPIRCRRTTAPGEFIFLADELYRYTQRSRAARTRCGRTCARRCATWSSCASPSARRAQPRRTTRALRPAAGVDQPRRLFGEADAFVLGRLLGAEGLRRARSASPTRSASRRGAARGAGSATSSRATSRLRCVASTAAHGIDYLPGAAELGDFDPTSTTIAFAPAGDLQRHPAAADRADLRALLARVRRAARRPQARGRTTRPTSCAPSARFVRLGWRERAQELLAFFMADRRPAAWNQWAEVVGRDAAQAALRRRHAARLDRVRLHPRRARPVRLRARRRPGAGARRRRSAGVARRATASALSGLRTPYGRLSYSLRKRRATRRCCTSTPACACRRAASSSRGPGASAPGATRINGKAAHVARRRAAHPRAAGRRGRSTSESHRNATNTP